MNEPNYGPSLNNDLEHLLPESQIVGFCKTLGVPVSAVLNLPVWMIISVDRFGRSETVTRKTFRTVMKLARNQRDYVKHTIGIEFGTTERKAGT